MLLREPLLREFNQESAVTRRVLERLPEDRWTWKPHPKSMSVQDLSSHLAHLPVWLKMTLRTDVLDLAVTPPNTAAADLAALLEHFETNVAEARAALAEATDEALEASWTLRVGEQVILTRPRIHVVRDFVLSHTIHHRAQLGVYLRLLDIPVPPMYGPTADDPGGF
jgi:uncharacterized damage-inducible protein DinB